VNGSRICRLVALVVGLLTCWGCVKPSLEAEQRNAQQANRPRSEPTGADPTKDDVSSGDVYDLGALQGLIGEWEHEAIAILPDGEEEVSVGSASIRPDLGGRFLVGRTRQHDGESEALQIWTFCPDRKTYRHWYFHSDGETVEGIGKYDESTRSLTWETEAVDGIVYERTERFADEDTYLWNGTLTDQEGLVVARIGGKLSRRK